jgi:hypothetical protein
MSNSQHLKNPEKKDLYAVMVPLADHQKLSFLSKPIYNVDGQ